MQASTSIKKVVRRSLSREVSIQPKARRRSGLGLVVGVYLLTLSLVS